MVSVCLSAAACREDRYMVTQKCALFAGKAYDECMGSCKFQVCCVSIEIGASCVLHDWVRLSCTCMHCSGELCCEL